MPPEGTLSRGRGRLVGDEAAGEFLFEIGELRYRIALGPEHPSTLRPPMKDPPTKGVGPGPGEAVVTAPSPLLRIDASVAGGPWCSVCPEAGMLLREPGGSVLSPVQAAERLQVTELRTSPRGKTLTLRYAENWDQLRLRRTVQVRLVGQTLALQVTSTHTDGRHGYCGFSFGTVGGPESRQTRIPYTIDPVYLLENGWFAAAYVDRLTSAATVCPPGAALYLADSSGAVSPISETLYVTVASDPLEALPLLEAPTSPHRADLARRLVLDVWSEAPFSTDLEALVKLRRYGLDHLLVHYHTWQQYGFGRRLPVHYPANPDRGTNEEFRRLIQYARGEGWLVALREDYSALSPETDYWDEGVVARTADGAPRPAFLAQWLGEPGTAKGEGSPEPDSGQLVPVERSSPTSPLWAVPADQMLLFARLESTKIERNYAPGAASAGSGAGYNPEDPLHQIDLDAHHKAVRTMAEAIRHSRALFHYLRELHGGPLIAEGGEGPGQFDTYYVGVVDSFERRLEGGAAGPVIPDYELRRVQPLMANHGVGYYARFFPELRGQATIDPSLVNWDLYRATQIAFGHAGFLSTAPGPPAHSSAAGPAPSPTHPGVRSEASGPGAERRGSAPKGWSGAEGGGQARRGGQGPPGLTSVEGWSGPDGSAEEGGMVRARSAGPGSPSPSGAPPPLAPWAPMGSMRAAFAEYFLMRAVQERLMTTPVRRIEYRHGEQLLELAGALRAGIDFAQAQLRIEYEGGLTVFVNRHARHEWSVRWAGMTYTLPPAGWLVGNGRDLLAYSALIGGNRADVVRSPEYSFLNVRSDVARRIEGITTEGAVAIVRAAVDGRRDLFVCGGKSVSDNDELLKLSDRADFSLRHRSASEVELCVLDSDSGGSVTVTLPYPGPGWEQGRLLLEEWEAGATSPEWAAWRRSTNQVQPTRRGFQLARLRPEVVYRLLLLPPS